MSSNWLEECSARLHWHALTGPVDVPVETKGRGGGSLDSIGESKPMLNFVLLLRLVYHGLRIEAPIHFFRVVSQGLWIEVLAHLGREK